MQVYACECTYRHLNGVQEVASSNLAAPIGLSDGSVASYGRVVFLAICSSDRNSDKHCPMLLRDVAELFGEVQKAKIA